MHIKILGSRGNIKITIGQTSDQFQIVFPVYRRDIFSKGAEYLLQLAVRNTFCQISAGVIAEPVYGGWIADMIFQPFTVDVCSMIL